MKQKENESGLYLTFRLGDELLALDVSRVQEVLDICHITRVPKTPEYMRGVINVRGNILPVIDLRSRFDMDRVESTVDARIVVTEVEMDGCEVVIGAIADSVHEVIEIDASYIGPPPRVGLPWRTEFVRGIGRKGERFLLLLDIDRLFVEEDASGIVPEQQRGIADSLADVP